MAKYKICFLPDTHFPFHSKEAISKVFDLVERIKPDIIIQCGDLLDFFSQSRFPKKPLERMSASDEIADGLATAEEFWKVLGLKAPKAKLIQLLGNHDVRPVKMIKEVAPSLTSFISLKQIYTFPKVELIDDYSDVVQIDGVAFHHGFKTKPLEHARHFESSACTGHTHRSWVHWEPINGKMRFDMSCGYLANPQHDALKYRDTKIHKWVHGVGVINKGQPRFIAFDIPQYHYKPITF